MRRWLVAALVLPGCAYAEPSPVIAAAASAIIPGLGQAAQGDYTTAAEHFGIFAVSLGLGIHYQHEREIINQTTLRRDVALRIATDMTLYSSFAAGAEREPIRPGGGAVRVGVPVAGRPRSFRSASSSSPRQANATASIARPT